MKPILNSALLILIGIAQLTVATGQGVPDNDSFGSPTLIGELPAILTGTNTGSTLEVGEPTPSGYGSAVKASVWFEWTAPRDGVFRIDTVGSDFDTAIAVWTGDQLANLVEQASDDDFSYYDRESVVAIQAVQGTTYRISLYGYRTDRGTYVLRLFESGSLAGQILGPDGSTPIQDREVSIYKWLDDASRWAWVQDVESDSIGRYRAIGLDEGYYKVRTYNFNSSSNEYWPGSIISNASGVIRVDRGVAVENIDFVLDSILPSGMIAGRITGINGESPLSRIRVTAYAYNPANSQWTNCGNGTTRDDGTYEIGKLPSGTYRIGFKTEGTFGDYSAYFHGGSLDVESAADVVLENDKSVVRKINGALAATSMLSGIDLSAGNLSPEFNPALPNYAFTVPVETSSISLTPQLSSSRYSVRINGSFITPGSASAPIPLSKGTNPIILEINEGGGPALRTYSILVTRGHLRETSLKSLVLGAAKLSPAFAADKVVYSANVPQTTDSVTVYPTPVKNAVVSVNGNPVASAVEGVKVALKPGFNTIDVSVSKTSGAGNTIYRIVVIRDRSSDSNLASLTIKGKDVKIRPAKFTSRRLNYSVRIPKSTARLSFLPRPSFDHALVTINGYKVGPKGKSISIKSGKTKIYVGVTAQDGSRKIYRVTVKRT